jgi:hypothetical protein
MEDKVSDGSAPRHALAVLHSTSSRRRLRRVFRAGRSAPAARPSVPVASGLHSGANFEIDMPPNTFRPAGGLLLAAAQENQLAPIHWVIVDAGDGLSITVSADALKAFVPDANRTLRLPVSYAETIQICRLLHCLPPTAAFSDAIWRATAVHPQPIGLVNTPEDARYMATLEWCIRHNTNVDKCPCDDSTLIADVGKDWILDNRLGVKGAVNYGWRSTGPDGTPRLTQHIGDTHDSAHYDYAQVLRVVQRTAQLDGQPVDLLDHLTDTIQAPFLAPYR